MTLEDVVKHAETGQSFQVICPIGGGVVTRFRKLAAERNLPVFEMRSTVAYTDWEKLMKLIPPHPTLIVVHGLVTAQPGTRKAALELMTLGRSVIGFEHDSELQLSASARDRMVRVEIER